MRSFVLLSIFALPLLVACGIACAGTSADLGKPVCSRYDDSPKSTEQHSNKDAASATVTATATTTGVIASTAPGVTATSKSGGTSSMAHTHGAPHWQTFLPGMFR
jgi:hypothetical protein